MDIEQTGLQLQPFHERGQPIVLVPYHSQLSAYHFLQLSLNDDRGIGVFYGPESSGKKTIISEFVGRLPTHIPVAVVDGARSKTHELLTAIMAQFDPGPSFSSVDEIWYALRIFLAEKTRTDQTPILILENINKMFPSALYALCKLAELQIDGRYLLRMILMSNQAPFSVVCAPPMAAIAKRSIGAFELGPMTQKESLTYIHAKLQASGCNEPRSFFTEGAIEELHTASGGWPGKLDALAGEAIRTAVKLPVDRQQPHPNAEAESESAQLSAVVEHVEDSQIQKLFLTFNRETLREIVLTESKLLIGRSGLCDVSIDSRFVSKCHAALIRTDSALHIMDLNSKNGTFVNSKRIGSKVLRHDDVISIGNHGIKLICPAYKSRPVVEDRELGETAAMMTLPELQRVRKEADEDAALAEKSKS